MTLKALEIRPGGCSMSELAAASLQVSATMRGIIDRLAERGLAARQRDPDDRRALKISLTTQGTALLEQIERQQRERMQCVFGELASGERQALLRLITLYLKAILSEIDRDSRPEEARDGNQTTINPGNP